MFVFPSYPVYPSKFNTAGVDKIFFSASREEEDALSSPVLLLSFLFPIPLETFQIETQRHDLKKNIMPRKPMQVFFSCNEKLLPGHTTNNRVGTNYYSQSKQRPLNSWQSV